MQVRFNVTFDSSKAKLTNNKVMLGLKDVFFVFSAFVILAV